ncbi:Ras GTPase-activating-like protein IQGAP1 [Serendipita indica DSM 11827]|nr:Ras GTPase-activating-like protein IQGAP1 [Serendipita indica DSM 11827]
MQRSDSVSSTGSRSSGTFGYHQRLLEGSGSNSPSVSRAASITQRPPSILSPPPGSGAARKWVPTHRTGQSVDMVQSRMALWEEKARASQAESTPTNGSTTTSQTPSHAHRRSVDLSRYRPENISSPPPRNDTPSKRHTLSTPIDISTYLPPSSQTPSTSVTTPTRDPISSSTRPSTRPVLSHLDNLPPETPPASISSSRSTETVAPSLTGSSTGSSGASNETAQPPSQAEYKNSYLLQRRSAKKYSDSLTTGRRLGRHMPRIASGDGNDDPEEPQEESLPPPPPPKEPNRVSANRFLEEKRRSMEVKSTTRVTSPVLPSQLEPHKSPTSPASVRHAPSPSMDYALSSPTSADDVAGVPGRLRLSKTTSAPTTPLKARPIYGLWADIQRHLIQAYEYLCHVGEAQQWIEGCLGEELPFGVVEMDEGLRNGVVLARLAQVWDGASVRKIFDDPRLKLGWRHTDNINHFLVFVRKVGLPECFIFIVTDLYDKKNIPKVIYCIHALSHLLARRGMAQRIGNLVGRLQFTDDQLQQTQRGLKDAGVPMPNFGDIGRELAKEINEEMEQEVETEDERRDRMLLEVEDSIVKLQTRCRGYLASQALQTQKAKLKMAERYVIKLQAQCRGSLLRRRVAATRQQQRASSRWVTALQARARGALARRNIFAQVRRIRALSKIFIRVQAQARGVLVRRRTQKLKAGLRTMSRSILKLQSVARARIVKKQHNQLAKVLHNPVIIKNVVGLQATVRGYLVRNQQAELLGALTRAEPHVVKLQARIRAALVRRRLRTQLAKLDDARDIVVHIQAAARAFMARKRLLNLIRGLRRATPGVVSLQALARAKLVMNARKELNKALATKQVIVAVGNLQTIARAALVRKQHQEQQKKLDFVAPDVVGFQAMARAALVRNEYWAWRDHLHRSQLEAIYLQSLCRGILQRRKFRSKVKHYRDNLHKVIKIQSLFRANQQREQYKQLTLGKNVNVSTIKNFVHLLDDSETDFQEEIEVEELRKRVVEAIRENQQLETDVSELDVKIGLVVQNVKSFEEVIRARKRHGADSAAAHAARASLLAAHGDPFAGPNTLDQTTKRKLELYQQLFYLLQTRGEYLARLFFRMSRMEVAETTRRMTERVVLTLFGYGQDRREDYLLLKLFQQSIHEEVMAADDIVQVAMSHPMYINVAFSYVRPKQVTYLRETLQGVIRVIVEQDDLDLETDPVVIYRTRINNEEMRTRMPSNKPRNVDYIRALEDVETRKEFIHHLQKLLAVTKDFVAAITSSTRKVPYSIRYLARETLIALKEKFPDREEIVYASAIGRLIYYRYINPALVAPESFDIVPDMISPEARKNLSEVSAVLTQITSGVPFGEENPSMMAINEYVELAIQQMSEWFLQVADVDTAEEHYHAHEFLDATVQPKPIYISPNEVYAMHNILLKNLDGLAPQREDTLRAILTELEGPPMLSDHTGSSDLHDARDRAITLELTNRFAVVRDEQAELKALWVRAKRGVLAILRVQPAKDLVESLMQPVTEDHELLWEEIIDNEMNAERMKQHRNRRMASTTQADASYRLEDIRSQSYRDMKAHAIFYLLELEKQGKVTRLDGYQDVLNAIASDVRSKHRKRLQRQQEKASMREALQHLRERKKSYEEQIQKYQDYVGTAMATMGKGKGPKKRFVMPFSKQYFHIRDLQRQGQDTEVPSYKYSAQQWYHKGILLSIDQFSPRQFDRVDIILKSPKPGLFTISIHNSNSLVATTDVRMEDLLQAQYENRVALTLFNGLAKFNLNLLLYQINKKFYV